MTYNKNETSGTLLPMTVTEGVTVNVLPNAQHEYLMTTKEVANGYGTTKYAIQQALYRNGSELIETKHYVTAWTICQRELLNSLNLPHNTVF
ncbi:MAG: hypothetical protein LBG92_06435, partial [Prevotellaceae bacterium]|nr:hypothetical protein [Prevotellaceae bacterium]